MDSRYETVNLVLRKNEIVNLNDDLPVLVVSHALPTGLLINVKVYVHVRNCVAWLNVQAGLVTTCALAVRVQPNVAEVNTHVGELSNPRSPEAFVPATELVTLSVKSPGQLAVMAVPSKLSLQLVVALLESVSLPDRTLPSALMVAVNSAVGQVMSNPPPISLIDHSNPVPETLVLTGVRVACAGEAAAAPPTLSTAISSKVLRKPLRVTSWSFLPSRWHGIGYASRHLHAAPIDASQRRCMAGPPFDRRLPRERVA